MDLTEQEFDEIDADIRSDFIEMKIKPHESNRICDSIKASVNKLFPDAECQDVIYTDNTDKMFFGIIVMPVFSHEEITQIVTTDDDWIKVKKYKVEIDSKIINGFVPITVDEITAFLLHDIGSLTNTNKPIIEARYYLDKAISVSSNSFKISDYSSYIELLGFGIKFTIRYLTSIFCNNKYVSNTFDDSIGISRFIESGLSKLINNGDIWDKESNNKGIVMDWIVRLYSDILKNRIPAIHTLNKCIDIYGSQLIKFELKNLILRLNRIDDFSLIKEEVSIPDQDIQKKIFKESQDIVKLEDTFEEIKALPVTNMNDLYRTYHRITTNIALVEYALEDDNLDKKSYYKLEDMLEYYKGLKGFLETTKYDQLKNDA